MENSLATLRPQLEKIKLSLIRRLPAMQELLDKVNYVLAIPHDTTIYTAEQKAAIASLKKDVQAYIRERAAKAGIVEDLNVHIQRIRDGNRALTELINKTIWNTSSIPGTHVPYFLICSAFLANSIIHARRCYSSEQFKSKFSELGYFISSNATRRQVGFGGCQTGNYHWQRSIDL